MEKIATFFSGTVKVYRALKVLKYAFWKYRLQFLVMTGLGFLGGMLGGLGIGMLIPLFAFVTQQDGGAGSTFHHFVSKTLAFFHLGYNLPLILGLMVSLFVAKAGIIILANYINESIDGNYVRDNSSMLFKKTLGSDWSFLMNQKVGYLDRIITGDVSSSGAIIMAISDVLVRIASLIAYAFIAFRISSTVTAISMIGGALIFISLKPLLYKARKLSRYLNVGNKELSHIFNESLIGAKTLKAFAVESAVVKKSSQYLENLRKTQLKISLIGNIQNAMFEPVSLLFVSGLFIYHYKSPDFNIASFAVIVYLIQKMYSFIQAIQTKLNTINSSFTYLNTMLEYQNSVDKNQEKSSGNKSFKFEEVMSVKEITFAYPGTDINTLSNIDFSIKKGEMIGLIGPSGSGKTTLVDLFLRLLKPQEGAIAVDNIDIDSIDLKGWRKNIGYVSQDIFLLNDTVETNIRFYDDSIRHEDIITAAKMANIYDFIQDLPNKFETQVGERGVKLSGGQRQRISLARVLAKKPSLLILDEATSSLDNESESLIQEAINGLKGKITVLAIAHRLSTVMNSDRLIVLDGGKLIETGTPDELIKNADSYLYKSYHVKDK
ncbi:MAG: ABC transporter ATP-binding protein [Candidatus Yanofskybacteria bacterium]|nr:ABC transporter ATP-binding protein [Candidatus Yanofskybacteria bacterium]